jgi:hypothetical protein
VTPLDPGHGGGKRLVRTGSSFGGGGGVWIILLHPTNAGFIRSDIRICTVYTYTLYLLFIQNVYNQQRERERGWQTDLEELLHVVVASPELADLGLAFRHQRLEPLLVPPVDCTRSELF